MSVAASASSAIASLLSIHPLTHAEMALTVRVPAPVAAGASLRRCPPVHSLMRPQLQRHIATAATHQITFRFPSGEEQVVACDSERYLLDAGLDANVDLPSCCSSGKAPSPLCAPFPVSAYVCPYHRVFPTLCRHLHRLHWSHCPGRDRRLGPGVPERGPACAGLCPAVHLQAQERLRGAHPPGGDPAHHQYLRRGALLLPLPTGTTHHLGHACTLSTCKLAPLSVMQPSVKQIAANVRCED